jgi:hypothetical protein
MIPFKNEYTIEKTINEQPSKEQLYLQTMFGEKVGKYEAQTYFERILDHKWYVSERLGRDIGLHVAALDFATNIEPLPVAKFNRRNTNGKMNRRMRLALTI